MTSPIRPRTGWCVGDLSRLLVATTARTALWTILLLAGWAALPGAFGWAVTTVVSDSMAPGVRTGDVVAAMPARDDQITQGRVLLVEDPDHDDRLRLHRLERIESDGALRLRGDANAAADRSTVHPDAVRGIGVLRFPGVGLPTVWIREGAWSSLLIAVAAIAVLVAASGADRPARTGAPCPRCGTPRWDLATAAIAPGTTRPAPSDTWTLPLVAAVTLATIALTVTADAAFSGSTTTASSLRSLSFSCFHGPTSTADLAWDFSEKEGRTVSDSSGHGRGGSLVGAGGARIDGSCADNPFARFGVGGDAEAWAIADNAEPAPQEFTIEAWFRTERADGGRIFGFTSDRAAASTYRDRHLYVDKNGTVRFGVQGSNGFAFTVASSTTVVDGQWHHAVGTFRSRSMTLWVDGVRQGSRADAVTLRQYDGYWRAARGTLSGWPETGSYAFTGDIDSARVHSTVLDDAAIAQRFAAGR